MAERFDRHRFPGGQGLDASLIGIRPPEFVLALRAQPGASRSGFNENFPLAYGHSSRALRFKIPVPLR